MNRKIDTHCARGYASKVWPVLMLALALLTAISGHAAERAKGVSPVSVVDQTLPIHQKQKLHPELSDPVLGDQAQIVEWAWSPQYAKRHNLPVQADGLKDGGLWLVGVSVSRKQSREFQRYTCNIVGLMDNKLPILKPPDDMYMITPGYGGVGGLPGVNMMQAITEFTPGQTAWTKNPKTKLEETFPTTGLTLSYLRFYRNFQPDTAFFEIEGACGYFRDPATHRNTIGFPGLVEGKSDVDRTQSAHNKSSAIKFDIPDSLMQKMYPYIREADDWTSCFMTRIYGKKAGLTTRALKSKRFGDICNPPAGAPTR